MKVLITGGAGYIGSILTEQLLGEGHAVTVLDVFRHGENSLGHLCHDRFLDIVCGDARDPRVVHPLAQRADWIVPLAAIVGAPACDADPQAAIAINSLAVTRLCETVSKSQRIVYPNTNSGYGRSDDPCTEDTPLKPLSLYGRTKCEAERTVLDAGGVSLRLATVFGASPRMRMDLLVNDFTWRAFKDKAVVLFESHFRRNYVHVRDVADAFAMALDGNMKGAYNVGDDRANMTKAQLCERIRQHVPGFTWLEAPVGEDPDKRDYLVSNQRIADAGWGPGHSIDDGIEELLKLYRGLRPARYANV